MEIVFTNHARRRLTERGISANQVTKTVKKPDIKAYEQEPVFAAYKVFGQHALKVVFKQEADTITVITLHWLDKERLKNVQPILEGES